MSIPVSLKLSLLVLLLTQFSFTSCCWGMSPAGQSLKPENLDKYSKNSPKDFLVRLKGKWYIQSSINFFMKGFKCFEADAVLSEGELNKITFDWKFKVYGFDSGMVDELTLEDGHIDKFSLKCISMPYFLRKFLDEENREVRVIGISEPNTNGDPDWVILFDCGNWITPYGELFFMTRDKSLNDELKNTINQNIKNH